MTYLGRYQLGQELVVSLACLDADGVATLPDRPPRMKIWSSSAKVVNKDIPIMDRYGTTGYFSFRQFLGSDFAAGWYTVILLYTLASGTHVGVQAGSFEVVAGGHSDGNIISMCYYTRPHADFCVTHLDSGKIQQRRNPSA